MPRQGALAGIKVLEMAGIGPAPFAAMLLADHGADVVRVDRREAGPPPMPGFDPSKDVLNRGRRSIALDVKDEADLETLRELIDVSDVLIESFRPGVMERLGLGPDECLARNPRLVYVRVSGWGQEGPYSNAVGHDANYISIAGLLSTVGYDADERPVLPCAYTGDFGGGGMLAAFSTVAALVERSISGQGQVIDTSILDGAAIITANTQGSISYTGKLLPRGENFGDGGMPFYNVYRTKDDEYMSVAAMEPRFYAAFLKVLGLENEDLPAQHDKAGFPILEKRFAEVIATKTRDEWARLAEPTEACLWPVLNPLEARQDKHNLARGVFGEAFGIWQPMPTPKFSRTPAPVPTEPRKAGADTDEVLQDWGVTA